MMHPILYHVGPLVVSGYGLMLVMSFVAGTLLARSRAERAGVDPDRILRLCPLVMLAAVAGSRLFHVSENLSFYAADPWRIVRIGEGGLSMYGGVLLAILTSVLYARAIGDSFLTLADICAPSIALGEVLTRIGCFLNGCCFGIRCDLPWGIVFPHESYAGRVFPGTPIHPTQLYSSLYSLLIFAILLAAERKRRAPGYVIGLFLVLHATARFLVEFVRYHEPSWSLFHTGLTSAQLISLSLFALGSYILWHRNGAAARRSSGGPTRRRRAARV